MKHLKLLTAATIVVSGCYLVSGGKFTADLSSSSTKKDGEKAEMTETAETKPKQKEAIFSKIRPTIEDDSLASGSQESHEPSKHPKNDEAFEELSEEYQGRSSDKIEKMNREISESQSTSPRNWFYVGEDVYQQVSEKSPGSYVSSVQCSERVCKVVVEHAGIAAKQQFDHGDGLVVNGGATASKAGDNGRGEQGVGVEDRHSGKTKFDAMASQRDNGTASGSYAPITHTYYQYSEEPAGKTVMYIVKSDIPSDPLALEQYLIDKKNKEE